MRHALILPALALALTTTSGCATILNGTQQTVEFRSRPGCATVMVDGRTMGGTPVSVKLSRKKLHHVRIGLPGYKTFDMILERRTSGWVWANLAYGSLGLVGIMVDALSGSMYYLSPRHLKASQLLGHRMRTHERGNRLVVFVALSPKVQPGWRYMGRMTRRPPPPPPVPRATPPRVQPPPTRYPSCR